MKTEQGNVGDSLRKSTTTPSCKTKGRGIFYSQKKAQKNKSTKNQLGGMIINNQTEKVTPAREPQLYKKRIGSTTFTVAVHFNPDSKETAGDKISRLIRNDTTAAGKAVNS